MTKKLIALMAVVLVLFTWVGAEQKLPKPANKEAAKKMDQAQKAVKKQDLDGALTLMKEVADMEPDFAPAYLLIGAIYGMKKDFDQALTHYEKSIEIKPDYSEAIAEYANLLNSMGHERSRQSKPQEAYGYYSRIVKIPNLEKTNKNVLIEACFNTGISAFQSQQFEPAIEAFSKLMGIPGVETDARQHYVLTQYMLGVNLSMTGKPEESNTYLNKYIELVSAEAGNPYAPVATYLTAKNEYALLEAEVEKAKKDDKITDKRAHVKGLAQAKSSIPKLVEKALAGNPDIEDAHVVLGNYYYLGGDLDQAIATYKNLVEKFATSPAVADYKDFLQKLEEEKKAPEAAPEKK